MLDSYVFSFPSCRRSWSGLATLTDPNGLEKFYFLLFSQVQGTPGEVDSACSSHTGDSEVNFPWWHLASPDLPSFPTAH